jgi:hypothetical protein
MELSTKMSPMGECLAAAAVFDSVHRHAAHVPPILQECFIHSKDTPCASAVGQHH